MMIAFIACSMFGKRPADTTPIGGIQTASMASETTAIAIWGNIRDVLPSCTYKKNTHKIGIIKNLILFLIPNTGQLIFSISNIRRYLNTNMYPYFWLIFMNVHFSQFYKNHRWMPCVDIREAICKFLDDIVCFSTYCITRTVLSPRHAQSSSLSFAREQRSM